jgi:hypothetical protein
MPLLGKDRCVWTGWLRQRVLLQTLLKPPQKIPSMALRYAERISKATGLPLEEVLKSQPFQNYLRKLTA